LLVQSGIALAIMTMISAVLGWIVAGRVLAPLRTITAATLRISEQNLHDRLALSGPRDELTALADTIDGLLARLEAAFDAPRVRLRRGYGACLRARRAQRQAEEPSTNDIRQPQVGQPPDRQHAKR
jgi:HAMP domain-containing protein